MILVLSPCLCYIHTHTQTQMLPLSTNIREAYKNGQEDEQNFIQNLALFLCTFLKEHAVLIEQKPELQNNLLEVRSTLASFPHCTFPLISFPRCAFPIV